MSRFEPDRNLLNGAALGIQAIAFYSGWKALENSSARAPTIAAFVVAGILALIAWRANRKRASAIDDTPTSKIASAAQGFVELIGRGESFPGHATLAPLSRLPCLWYRYTIEERVEESASNARSSARYVTRESGCSDDTFRLNDQSGICVVDPRGAEIHTTRRDTWKDGDWRYTEWLLLERDTLYALGEFKTIRASDASRALTVDVSDKLNTWKADRGELLRRFDRNGDGEIDLEEWDTVRQAAQAEVVDERRADSVREGYHRIAKPGDGRPFILANKAPDKIVFAYRWWGRLHMLNCWLVLAALAWLANHHL